MPEQTLLLGESPIKNAPSTQLSNGSQCIPQHYLLFNHNYDSVSRLITDIEYDDRYPVFVCEDKTGLYIQVGIIGFDNYNPRTDGTQKIVYGRKWRVEPELPTSEVIQTVFLALKKAREHEVREFFRLTLSGYSSTPFNNHLDLPVMARHAKLLQCPCESVTLPTNYLNEMQTVEATLQKRLDTVQYEGASFKLETLQPLTDQLWFAEVALTTSEPSELAEQKSTKLHLLLNSMDNNQVYYQLMEALITLSDRDVDEHFRYRGFARFSQRNNIEAMAKLSLTLRKNSTQQQFLEAFEQANYQTDLRRVPGLDNSHYAKRIRSQLAKFRPLEGILPKQAG